MEDSFAKDNFPKQKTANIKIGSANINLKTKNQVLFLFFTQIHSLKLLRGGFFS